MRSRAVLASIPNAMLGLDSIHLDAVGLQLLEKEVVRDRNARMRAWSSGEGDGVALFFFSVPPDLAAPLTDLDGLRRDFRSKVPALLELERVRIEGCDFMRTIFKQPQQPHGMAYVGTLLLPFRDCSWVVKAQCEERGITGVREAVILDRRISDLKLPGIEGWQADRYDPSFRAPLQRNLAEAEEYDAEFPDHPLSRLRRLLQRLVDGIRLEDDVRALPPFAGSAPPPPRKKWWPF
jgi:hypothetical protein